MRFFVMPFKSTVVVMFRKFPNIKNVHFDLNYCLTIILISIDNINS